MNDIFANLIGYIIIVTCFTVLPTILMYIVYKPLQKLKSQKFKDKLGKMYEDYRIWEKAAVANNLVYLLRRFLLIVILFAPFFVDHIIIQIIALSYI